ncbi:13E12 repeat family protein [Kribbella sp. NBC_01505]|uniref:DUF222 domain-containing protein n=1 Tax=Kribbella sp. NBC_01505 TaxID=2903580 RepID=UPI00386EDD06
MVPIPACVPDEHPPTGYVVTQASAPGTHDRRPAASPLTSANWSIDPAWLAEPPWPTVFPPSTEPDLPDDLIEIPDEFEITEEDLYDDLPPMSKVDALEWELWSGHDQDEAEREMLRREAPAWVFLPPGGELAAALENVRPQSLSPMALIEFIKATERLAAWTAAMKATAMASFYRQRKAEAADLPRPTVLDSSGRPVDPERSWAAEIGAALHLSTNTTVRHLETALRLTGPLAATLAAVRTGSLPWAKALAISEATRDLSDRDAQAVEAHVLRRAPSQTHTNLRKSLRTQVAKYSAATEADRHRAAVQERTCKIVPLPDGMAGLWIVHTADKIQQVWVAVQGMADLAKRDTPATPHTNTDIDTNERADAAKGSGSTQGANTDGSASPKQSPTDADQPEKRTADQRRADVVVDLFSHILTNTDADHTSRSSSQPAPCSDWTTTPANSPATAPSPQRSAVGSQPTVRGAGSSPTP